MCLLTRQSYCGRRKRADSRRNLKTQHAGRLNFVPNAYRMLSVRNTARLYEAARERGHGVSYLLDPEEKK